MLKTKLMKSAFAGIYHSGAARLMAPAWGGIGVIFCLHHVLPGGGQQSGFAPNNNLETTPEFLAALIRHVRLKGYDTVSLDDAVGRLLLGNTSKRFAVFTLDDGYKDNLIHAMPVFVRERCPFTVYVAPDLADAKSSLWWRGLETVIGHVDQLDVDLSGGQRLFKTETVQDKWTVWQILGPYLQGLPEFEQRIWIEKLATRYGVDLLAQCREAIMTWDEIREMASNPFATIGAHTLSHYNLKKLPAQDAMREIRDSGKRISTELGLPVRHFAYPYGNKDAAGPREFQMANEADYTSAVVTRLGPVESAHAQHIHALPRIMISGRYQDLRYIDALLSGVPSRLSNGFQGHECGLGLFGVRP